MDKCEEIMTKGKWKYGTKEIFRDLMQYTKMNSETSGDGETHLDTSPRFVLPEGSAKTLNNYVEEDSVESLSPFKTNGLDTKFISRRNVSL